jgi:hypothetical protein
MLRLLLLTTTILFSIAAPVAANEPINVGGRKQLFIDERFIGASHRIELRTNPAQKLGRIRDPDGKPIPMAHIGRVFDVDGTIRMYIGADAALGVLVSEDGLQFKNTGRGIVTKGYLPTLFFDPHDPDPKRRYKVFSTFHQGPFDREIHGIYAAYSADGFEFTEAGRVLPFFIDNPCVMHWDERIGTYVIFTRAFSYESDNQRRIARIETDEPLKPWPYVATPEDRERLAVSNAEVVLQADEDDYFPSDIYYNSSAIYAEAEDVYLMFTAQFRHFYPDTQPFVPRKAPGEWEDFGMLEIQLAVSRDGVHWQRPTREPYFPIGLPDEWDRWFSVMGPGIVRRGNYLYQYYYSSGRLHDSTILREEYRGAAKELGGIGVVRQRLDGFVSADADYKGGWLETPVIEFEGNRLRLNIDTGSMGTAFVEIRDDKGQPIPGFGLEDCEEVGGNFIDQRVYFKGNPDVSALAGKPIKLYFKLMRAKLFAFQFTPN